MLRDVHFMMSELKSSLVHQLETHHKSNSTLQYCDRNKSTPSGTIGGAAKVKIAVTNLLRATAHRPSTEYEEEKAQHLIADVIQLVDAAFEKASKSINVDQPTTSDIHNPRVITHREHDVQRLRAMMAVHATIEINQRRPRERTTSTQQLIPQHLENTVQMANGTISIRTTRLKGRNQHGQAKKEVASMCTITFITDDSQFLRYKLSVHLLQISGIRGLNSMPPTIIAHRFIPNDSEIFTAIKDDDFDAFQAILGMNESGTATGSIWDCDESGRSLLYYACYYHSFDIAKLLVSSGLDVDSWELRMNWEELQETTLLQSFGTVDCEESDIEELQVRWSIRQLLLEADADPTDPAYDDSYWEDCIYSGTCESLRQLLDMDGNWGCQAHHNDIGQDIFLQVASFCQAHSASILELLVTRGTDIHAQDVYGRDALFSLFDSGPRNHMEGSHLDSVCYLLSLGLDKYTTDDDDRTIFDILYAYSPEKHPGRSSSGSYKRDLWFAALEHHSRSISSPSDRHDFDDWKNTYHRMRSVYTRSYTPFHHRALLRGDSWKRDDHCLWKDWFNDYLWPEDLDGREECIIAHQALIFRCEHVFSGRLEEPAKMWSHGVEIEINLDRSGSEGDSPMKSEDESVASEIYEDQDSEEQDLEVDVDDNWVERVTLFGDENEITINEPQDTSHGVEIAVSLDDTNSGRGSSTGNQDKRVISNNFEEQNEESLADFDRAWSAWIASDCGREDKGWNDASMLRESGEELRIEDHQDTVEDTEADQTFDKMQALAIIQPSLGKGKRKRGDDDQDSDRVKRSTFQ